MNDNIIRLLPVDEEAILRCYITGSKEPASFQQLYDTLEVPVGNIVDEITSRLQIAVAQILLHGVQDSLPQWAAIGRDADLLLNRRRHRSHARGILPFHPHRLFSINWATSGPGYDWPEEHRVTYLPGFNKYIFTASRDGDDAFGCADHAIGVADGGEDVRDAARRIITTYWRTQVHGWDKRAGSVATAKV